MLFRAEEAHDGPYYTLDSYSVLIATISALWSPIIRLCRGLRHRLAPRVGAALRGFLRGVRHQIVRLRDLHYVLPGIRRTSTVFPDIGREWRTYTVVDGVHHCGWCALPGHHHRRDSPCPSFPTHYLYERRDEVLEHLEVARHAVQRERRDPIEAAFSDLGASSRNAPVRNHSGISTSSIHPEIRARVDDLTEFLATNPDFGPDEIDWPRPCRICGLPIRIYQGREIVPPPSRYFRGREGTCDGLHRLQMTSSDSPVSLLPPPPPRIRMNRREMENRLKRMSEYPPFERNRRAVPFHLPIQGRIRVMSKWRPDRDLNPGRSLDRAA